MQLEYIFFGTRCYYKGNKPNTEGDSLESKITNHKLLQNKREAPAGKTQKKQQNLQT